MPTAAATVANLYQDRIKAKKSLGQNFVTDDAVLREIVSAAGVGPGDRVLEIGPGTGNLTKHLLACGAHVTAVEKDDTLYARLLEQYNEVPELSLVSGDALAVGLEDIVRGMLEQGREPPPPPPSTAAAGAEGPQAEQPSTSAAASGAAAAPAGRRLKQRAAGGGSSAPRVKVVANLPYNITKDLILMLLPLGDVISDLHIMIQHEAAERLTAKKPGGPEWRAVNIRTLYYCNPKYRFRISREKYDPVPGVDGALVTFSLRPPAARQEVPGERAFMTLVTVAFAERRKKMRNSLAPLYSASQVQAALVACGLNPDARAQDLTLDEFVALSWALQKRVLAEELHAGKEAEEAQEAKETKGAAKPRKLSRREREAAAAKEGPEGAGVA